MGVATTKKILSNWFDKGIEKGATHMIVVCDTFDGDDYPVYVMPDQDVREIKKNFDGVNMQKVMEIYNMFLDKEYQLGVFRANYIYPNPHDQIDLGQPVYSGDKIINQKWVDYIRGVNNG